MSLPEFGKAILVRIDSRIWIGRVVAIQRPEILFDGVSFSLSNERLIIKDYDKVHLNFDIEELAVTTPSSYFCGQEMFECIATMTGNYGDEYIGFLIDLEACFGIDLFSQTQFFNRIRFIQENKESWVAYAAILVDHEFQTTKTNHPAFRRLEMANVDVTLFLDRLAANNSWNESLGRILLQRKAGQ